ncbi:MAG: ABC transporter permease [Gemmatimonadota bacterium]|nr:MAG: ABC transporter permease [Gemmatimonadota bacterium]
MRASIRISRQLYRALISLYPRSFRAEYGAELLEAFVSIGRSMGPWHMWCRTLPDFLATLVSEWLDVIRSGRTFLGGSRGRGRPGGGMSFDIVADLKYASRQLARRPGYAAVGIVTLALGIGANTALFTVVNGVLLRPLPYHQPGQLVTVWQTYLEWRDSPSPQLRGVWDQIPASYPVYEDWLELNSVFVNLGAYYETDFAITGGDRPERLRGLNVTFGTLAALGVPPMLGRAFRPEDDRMGSERVVVMSNGFWRRRFGSDRAIVGQSITLDDVSVIVVGVMPPGFYFPDQGIDVWANMDDEDRQLGRGITASDAVIARLRPGITLTHAQRDMEAVTERIAEANPGQHEDRGVRLVPLHEEVVGNLRPPMVLLLSAVGVVLVIACANIANLLLVRATGRQKELAVRSALGAGRWRLARQLLSEAAVLSLLGGAVGVTVAVGALRPLALLLPPGTPRASQIAVDQRVLMFSLGLTIITVLLIGVLPAITASRTQIVTVLKDSSRWFRRAGQGHRSQSMLVISQIAFAYVLLAGAGILVKSFASLLSVDKGFTTENVLALEVRPPTTRYPNDSEVRQYYTRLYERLEAVPSVRSVGGGCCLPFTGHNSSHSIVVESDKGEDEAIVDRNVVSGSYFETMGIPIVAGRVFHGGEETPVAVISSSMAHQFWPGEDPIGRRITYRNHSIWFTVVGVVGDVSQHGLDVLPRPTMYYAFHQATYRARMQTILLRTDAAPAARAADVRNALWEVDGDVPVRRLSTMDDLISMSVAAPRFRTLLLSLLATLAGVLATFGIYGVVAFSVSQQTQEIGIRMALGARSVNVVGSVLRRGLVLASTGLAIGLGITLVAARVLESFLFEVSPRDPTTLLGVGLLLTAAAMAASYVPSRRATSVDPVEALRVE